MSKRTEMTRLTKDGEEIGVVLSGGQIYAGKVVSENETIIRIKMIDGLELDILAQGITAIWYPATVKKEEEKNV